MKMIAAIFLAGSLAACTTFHPQARLDAHVVQPRHHRVAPKQAKRVRAPVVVPPAPIVIPPAPVAPIPTTAPKKRTFLGIPLVH